MRVSTAARVVFIIIAVKAVLIGIVGWRRATILSVQIEADSWIAVITTIAIGLALGAGGYLAARHSRRKPQRCKPRTHPL